MCTRVLQTKKRECSRKLEFFKLKKGEKTTLFYKKKILNNVFMTSLTKVYVWKSSHPRCFIKPNGEKPCICI